MIQFNKLIYLEKIMKNYLFSGLILSLLSLQTYAQTPNESNYSTQPLTGNFELISGNGGNITLYNGETDVLIDNGYTKNSDSLLRLLTDKGANIDYVINTHWHGDHTGGNLVLADATIIGHENVHVRLSSPQEVKFFNIKTKAQPEEAKPDITYQTEISLFVDDQQFNIVYYFDSHTDSDSAVFIQPANIAVLGDLYFSNMFPFIDPDSKANINNLIISLESVIEKIDDKTLVVPGHGKLSNQAELQATINMLKISRDTVKACKDQGQSAEDCKTAGLPDELVKVWGNGFIKEEAWVGLIYDTL